VEGYSSSTYGDRAADVYDEHIASVAGGAETLSAVEFLSSIAGSGPVLELGIGDGRLAIPLADRGLEVHGIDASPAMVARLKAKPGASGIRVVVDDFREVPIDGTYDLVFAAFNTFFGLVTQEAQVRCFHAVADRLTPSGAFVIEAFAPDPSRYDRGQRVQVTSIELNRVQIAVSLHEPKEQRVTSQHVILTPNGLRLIPVVMRYAWPSELDFMAQTVGLRLRDRWASWYRDPFVPSSVKHISVYVFEGLEMDRRR
jgi:hypothetical protein